MKLRSIEWAEETIEHGASGVIGPDTATMVARDLLALREALHNVTRIAGPTPMRSREDGDQFHAAMLLLREES